MVHWIWILVAVFSGGFLGMMTISIFAAKEIAELKLWNRRLQRQRDDAVKDAVKDAKRYRTLYRDLMKVEQ